MMGFATVYVVYRLSHIPKMPKEEARKIFNDTKIQTAIKMRQFQKGKAFRSCDHNCNNNTSIFTLRSGDLLYNVLLSAGFNHVDIVRLSRQLRKKRVKFYPGQKITVNYDKEYIFEIPDEFKAEPIYPQYNTSTKDFKIKWVKFMKTPETEVTLSRQENDHFDFQKRQIELVKKSHYHTGEINESVFVDMIKTVSPNILVQYISLFSFDLDFQRDIRKGDKFAVLYESFYDKAGNFVKDGQILYLSLKGYEYYGFNDKSRMMGYYDKNGKNIRKSILKTPINGARLSSPFGYRRHPILGYSKLHTGVDFAAPRGTPIFAGGDGVITKRQRYGSYGNYIRIKHNATYSTAYAHMSKFRRGFRVGSRVKQGQVIGYVGTTGRSTGPHLHYEVLKNGRHVNPNSVPRIGGKKIRGETLAKFRAKKSEIDSLISDLSSPKVESTPS